jgi:hypothetical protein
VGTLKRSEAVEHAEKERVRLQIEADANQHFPGAVQSVMVLEHSDERPGKMIVQVHLSPAGPDGQERTLRAFWLAHRPEMGQFRRDLSQRFPQVQLIQFTMTSAKARDPRAITMTLHHDASEAGRGAGSGGQ